LASVCRAHRLFSGWIRFRLRLNLRGDSALLIHPLIQTRLPESPAVSQPETRQDAIGSIAVEAVGTDAQVLRSLAYIHNLTDFVSGSLPCRVRSLYPQCVIPHRDFLLAPWLIAGFAPLLQGKKLHSADKGAFSQQRRACADRTSVTSHYPEKVNSKGKALTKQSRNLLRVALIEYPTLEFHGRRKLACFDSPILRNNGKALQQLEVGE
jgi:hypothetical protein